MVASINIGLEYYKQGMYVCARLSENYVPSFSSNYFNTREQVSTADEHSEYSRVPDQPSTAALSYILAIWK